MLPLLCGRAGTRPGSQGTQVALANTTASTTDPQMPRLHKSHGKHELLDMQTPHLADERLVATSFQTCLVNVAAAPHAAGTAGSRPDRQHWRMRHARSSTRRQPPLAAPSPTGTRFTCTSIWQPMGIPYQGAPQPARQSASSSSKAAGCARRLRPARRAAHTRALTLTRSAPGGRTGAGAGVAAHSQPTRTPSCEQAACMGAQQPGPPAHTGRPAGRLPTQCAAAQKARALRRP
jgi:hypothetical protein